MAWACKLKPDHSIANTMREIWVIISRLGLFMILAQRAGIAPTSMDATKV